MIKRMVSQKLRWWVLWLAGLVLTVPASGFAQAEETKGMMERVEDTASRVGAKIEEKTKAVVKKVQEKHVVDKVEQKLKKAATKTAEGFEKAGRKIEEKLGN